VKFLGINDVIRANAEQLTACIFSLLKKYLHWVPPKQVLTDTLFNITDVYAPDEILNDELEEEDAEIDNIEIDELSDIEEIEEEEVAEVTDEDCLGGDADPLFVGFISDGANVLTGKRAGVNVKLRAVCNNLMLNGHCVSHRCQLQLKKTGELESKLFKELNEFLEKLFVFHKTSNVISNVYRNTVKVLNITGSSAVIRVNGTRWITHASHALTNLLNARKAHIEAYDAITHADSYSKAQKSKARYFLGKLNSSKFMSFAVYTLDIVKAISCFSLV
jgi:hypothetical protein